MRQIFLDTETTGLSPDQGDRVVELGCVEMDGRQRTGRHLHFYLNPQRPNSEEAVRVHGLTDAFLADKPLFSAVAAEFIEFIRGAELVIHNASFDVGFLDAELRRVKQPGCASLAAGIVDTLAMAREAYPGKANSLDALCRRLEVDNSKRTFHGALLDAELLAEVYIRMTRGQNALVMEEEADESEAEHGDAADVQVDFSVYALPVLEASADELVAHEAALVALDKACGGKTIWRQGLAKPT